MFKIEAETTVNVNYILTCTGKKFEYQIEIWEQDGTFTDDFIASISGEGGGSHNGALSGSDTWDEPFLNQNFLVIQYTYLF